MMWKFQRRREIYVRAQTEENSTKDKDALITEYLNSHPDVSKYRAAKALSLSPADVYEWGQKKLEEEKQKKGGSGKTPQKKDITIENWLGEDNKS